MIVLRVDLPQMPLQTTESFHQHAAPSTGLTGTVAREYFRQTEIAVSAMRRGAIVKVQSRTFLNRNGMDRLIVGDAASRWVPLAKKMRRM